MAAARAVLLAAMVVSAQAATIRLGFISQRSFGGVPSTGGFQSVAAMVHMIEYLNELNGTHTYELILREASLPVEGRGTQAERCEAAAASLVQDEGVVAVIGPSTSACAKPSAEVLGTLGVAQVSPSATAISLSDKSLFPTFFRVVASDLMQASSLARLFDTCPSWNKINVVATTDPYGSQLAASFVAQLQQRNVTVMHDLRLEQKDTAAAISNVVDQLRDSNVAITAIFALRQDVEAILERAQVEGMSGPDFTWLTSDGFTSEPTLVSPLLLDAFKGMIGVGVGIQQTPLLEVIGSSSTAHQCRAFFDDVTGSLDANALLFDSVLAAHHAINQVVPWPADLALQRAGVVAALKAMNSSENGAAGARAESVYFDNNQDGSLPFAFFNLVDQQWLTVTPSGSTYDVADFVWSKEDASTCPLDRVPTNRVQSDRDGDGDDNNLDVIIVGVAAAVIVLLAVICLVAYHVYMKHKHPQPCDFTPLVQQLGLPPGREVNIPREIPRSCVKTEEIVGEGHYGAVHKATLDEYRFIGVPAYQVAAKVVQPAGDASELLKEAAIMAQFGVHENVVSLIGVVTAGEPVMVVLQFCEHGALDQLLESHAQEGHPFRLSRKMQWACEIAAGMEYIANLDGVHRDLAARNVLVTSNWTCKVSDFGLSREGQVYVKQTSLHLVPVRWTAPEGLKQGTYTSASDVWSYGITLHEIVTDGQLPYGNLSNRAVMISLTEIPPKIMPRPAGCPTDLYQIMKNCWQQSPLDRPTFTQLKQSLLTMRRWVSKKERKGKAMSAQIVLQNDEDAEGEADGEASGKDNDDTHSPTDTEASASTAHTLLGYKKPSSFGTPTSWRARSIDISRGVESHTSSGKGQYLEPQYMREDAFIAIV